MELLEAQRDIEEVEAKARQHILRERIAEIRSEFYCVNNFSTDEGRFITTIANVALTGPVYASAQG